MMQALGVPPLLVPHGEPHSGALAASLVARALARAPPLPTVKGVSILSKPASVQVKLRLGIVDVQEAPPALAVAPLEAGLPLASPARHQPVQLLADIRGCESHEGLN